MTGCIASVQIPRSSRASVGRAIVASVVLFSVCAALSPRARADQGEEKLKRTAQLVRLTLPIDSKTVSRVQQTVRRAIDKEARPYFIFEFDVPANGADGGRGTQFEDAHKLARILIGKDMNAANTVAFIPKSIKGHAVLVALACEQIFMAEDARIGEAGIDEETVDDTMRTAYRTIANSRRTVPEEVALALLDKQRELWRVQVVSKQAAGIEFLSPAEMDQRQQKGVLLGQKERLKAADQPWSFTGSEGSKWGFVKYLAGARNDVARGLDLPPEAISSDPSKDGKLTAIRVNLRGVIKHDGITSIQKMISDKIREDSVNFVCLWIDSPGGSVDDSIELANFLADLDANEVRTVAYIENEALGDAAIVAMACDQVVMLPGAKLGGPGAQTFTAENVAAAKQTIRDSIAHKKLRSWSLWAAMIDPDLEVHRCTRLGETEYFSDEELQKVQPAKGDKGPGWERQALVTAQGSPLKLSGEKAAEYRVASFTVENFGQFKQYYGLENDPALVEPGWADFLINALRRDEVAFLLLFLGGAALYFELHTPGLGIGAFVATVCFALFFWSRFLNGTAGWLQVVLFVTGIVFILLEVFVLPGFGIFGLGGGALVLLSLILASQTFFIPKNDYQMAQMQRSLLIVAAAVGGLIVTAFALRSWLPRAPVLHHVLLPPPEGEEAETISRRESLVDLGNLLGKTGVTATPLVPGGKARFGNHLVDVVADGEFVTRDRPVVVVEVHGNRVVVRPVG